MVEQVEVGETVAWASLGASVAVSPDRRWVAVTSVSAATVIDTRTREVVEVIEMTPDGPDDPDGEGLAPSAVWSAAWTLDGARLLLGVERAAPDRRNSPSGDIVVYDTATWTEVDRVPIDVVPEDIELEPGRPVARRGGPQQQRGADPGRRDPRGTSTAFTLGPATG